MARLQEFNVVAVVKGQPRRFAKVTFGADGSIYVHFPGLPRAQGIVSICTLKAGLTYPTDVRLSDQGKIASAWVKYSHHTSGVAHFSQPGRVRTDIRKKSSPLTANQGHLFTIQAQGLGTFEKLKPKTPSGITLNVEGEVETLKVAAWWYDMNKFEYNGDATGPKAVEFPDGTRKGAVFVAPPIGRPLDNFTLVLVPEKQPWLSKDQDPSVTFIGGFDPGHIARDPSKDTAFLGLIYPCADADELRGKIGSIDF